MKIIGIQDFSMSPIKYLDPSTSLSWIRAFEKIDAENHVYLKIHKQLYSGGNYNFTKPLNNIYYHFRENFENIHTDIIKHSPDIILYNFCYVHLLVDLLNDLRHIKECVHIIRFHHEAKYLLRHEDDRNKLFEILEQNENIFLVVPMDPDKLFLLNNLSFSPDRIFTIPFGIDIDQSSTIAIDKSYDCISSMSTQSTKNQRFLMSVFEQLENRGFKCKNAFGIDNRDVYLDILKKSYVYFTPSLTEGGASRSLLEAVACGCFPVCATENDNVSHFVNQIGGESIDVNITINYPGVKGYAPEVNIENQNINGVVDFLEKIINQQKNINKKFSIPLEYIEKNEIESLISIINNFSPN